MIARHMKCKQSTKLVGRGMNMKGVIRDMIEGLWPNDIFRGPFGLELLADICGVPSVSGAQLGMQHFLRTTLAGLVTEFGKHQGNLFAIRRGATDRGCVLFIVHIDRVGFLVSRIDKETGALRVRAMGGIDPAAVLTNYVEIHTKLGPVPGVIGCTPVHFQKGADEKKPLKPEDLFVIPQGAFEENASIRVGDPISIFSPLDTHSPVCLRSLALDDGLGVWQGCNILRIAEELYPKLNGEQHPTIIVCFTTEEETGARGAERAVHHLIQRYSPDLAIVVDTTASTAIPGVSKDVAGDIGLDGPVITFADGGMVYTRPLVEDVIDVASELAIVHYIRATPFGGTDGSKVAITGGGVATVSVSTPSLNIHTASMSIKKAAARRTLLLLSTLLLDPDTSSHLIKVARG